MRSRSDRVGVPAIRATGSPTPRIPRRIVQAVFV
jgi:hypothetical protein